MVVHPMQTGEVFTMNTPEEALNNMIILHKHGIETCLHSYFNGNELTALEIVYIPECQLVKYKEAKDE